jgi:serine/threonine protein kinase
MEAGEAPTKANDDLIISLFQAAMSRPPEEREEFIAEACADDSDLRAQVTRRVMWEARLNGFLLKPLWPRERMDRPFVPGETVLHRFRILRVAGEGGMGVVYEALDEKLGHRIALKCPRFEHRRRLSPEVMNSLRVTHTNVCRVFEIHTAETETGEVDFLTMEFVDGETLADRLRDPPRRWLRTAEGMDLAKQLCAGLHAIHAQGVIHRDLKPSNVMLSKDPSGRPRAVISDFGIAQGGDLFSSGMRGTPAYIAPELWKAQPASPQSDIYSLGVLLYEMASGSKQFPETIHWKERLSSQPPVPDVYEPARSAIRRCMHPDPARRFASVAEVERALRRGARQGNVRKRLVLTYGWTHDINEALRLLQGTPADLARDLSNSPELSPGLRTDPRFERLTH